MSLSIEKLHCPREKPLSLPLKPHQSRSTVLIISDRYGLIITSQEPWAIKHDNVLFTQPGLVWFYGAPNNGEEIITYD